MENMRKETKIGLFIGAVYLVLNRFTGLSTDSNISAFFMGVLLGLWLVMLIVGMIPKVQYDKLKAWKKSILKTQ